MDASEMDRETYERLIDLARAADGSLTRRRFLQVGGLSVVALSALGPWLAAEAAGGTAVIGHGHDRGGLESQIEQANDRHVFPQMRLQVFQVTAG